MSKKSTRIAYLVALGVLVVLLVFLGVTYAGVEPPVLEVDGEMVQTTTPFAGTFWSLLPPIVAIVLALISKEVYSSLFMGCLVGAMLCTQFAPWETLVQLVGGDNGIVTTVADSGNVGIIFFLVCLGIMVDLMNKGGGSEAFGRWATKSVKSRAGAQLLTMLLGVLIFIDDYFNCLTVGAVMRPVTESHQISRAKLAYIIDSTAAPVCMIAPVSSWAAAVSGYVQSDSVNGLGMFMRQIPYNYYCLLTLVMIIVTSLINLDYGPMLKHEYNAQVKGDLFTTEERPFAGADDYEKPSKGNSSVVDLILPVVVLIAACVIGLIWTGGFFDSEAPVDFMTAFSNATSSTGLSLGGMIGLLFTFIYFWLRRTIDFDKSFESVPNGFIQMISPILILTFAWTLCAFTRYGMYSANFVIEAMSGAGSLMKFLPAVIFLIGCFIGFATGTSWGTIGIMAPIVVNVFNYDDPSLRTLCVIGLAAACAGGVCGDHCSPISDTTIMASAGAHCYHLNHVFTQLPYAITVACVSFVSFIIAGLIQNVVICLIIAVALMLVTLFVIKAIVSKKHADMFAEMAEANKALHG